MGIFISGQAPIQDPFRRKIAFWIYVIFVLCVDFAYLYGLPYPFFANGQGALTGSDYVHVFGDNIKLMGLIVLGLLVAILVVFICSMRLMIQKT